MISASYLFAKNQYNSGNKKCFYCGIDCNESFAKKDFVKPTFTNRDVVKYPGSDFVCGCCVSSLRTGGDDLTLVDGDVKTGRSATPRMYSWLLCQSGNVAFSKRHLDYARTIVTNPPNPPFSIVLADSGQKQIIFRAAVNYDKESFSVLLEEESILVDRKVLVEYLDVATVLSAAIGKIALREPDQFLNYKNTVELYGCELPLIEWMEIYSSPVGRLAAWLCQGKKEALNADIVRRRLQEEISGNN